MVLVYLQLVAGKGSISFIGFSKGPMTQNRLKNSNGKEFIEIDYYSHFIVREN